MRSAEGWASAVCATGSALRDHPLRLIRPSADGLSAGPSEQESRHLRSVRLEAARIVGGERCVFGHVVRIKTAADYRTDPLSGRRWPGRVPSALLRPGAVVRGSDVRAVWELNRCHHTVKLAQAWAATGDDGFARALIADFKMWSSGNPLGRGINWTCAMEVAIRLVNWVAAAGICAASPAWTDETDAWFLRVAGDHLGFILGNLEDWGASTQNHYVADLTGVIVGLVYLPVQAAQPGLAEWVIGEIERCVAEQLSSDGIDFENSIAYHCFVAEMLAYAVRAARDGGLAVSDPCLRAVARMGVFVRDLACDDGSLPCIGDSDDGRLLVLGDYFARGGWLQRPGALSRLIDGAVGHSEPAPRDMSSSRAFAHGGFYVLRSRSIVCTVNAAPTGVNGVGPHRHHDALSFEVCVNGAPFIVDSGTYCYQHDPASRLRFRRTAAHNCLVVDGVEQSPLSAAFGLTEDTFAVTVAEWSSDRSEDRLHFVNVGYQRLLKHGVRHRRAFVLDKEAGLLEIVDEVAGDGVHDVEWYCHLHPGVSPTPLWAVTGEFTIESPEVLLRVAAGRSAFAMQADIAWRELSWSYRRCVLHPVVRVRFRDVEFPFELRVRVETPGGRR